MPSWAGRLSYRTNDFIVKYWLPPNKILTGIKGNLKSMVASICTMIMVQMDDFAGFRPYAPSFQIRDFYGQKRKTRNLTFVLNIQDNYIINQAYHNLYLFYNFCIKF